MKLSRARRFLRFLIKIFLGDFVRIAKYLSECGVASRRAAEELVLAGKVKVNDEIISNVATGVDPDRDQIRVRNKIVKPPQKGVLLFNKPREVVSTLSDPQERTCISDYLGRQHRSYFPVGRLDWDSSGLMVLTNDGELANLLMHPRYQFKRIYHAKVSGRVTEKTLRRFPRGIRLHDGVARADVKIIRMGEDVTWLEVAISEGRNRIIRRLMDMVRHPVIKLQRVAHGPVKLGRLQPGVLRQLTDKEYQELRKTVFAQVEGGTSATKPRSKRRVTSKSTPRARQ